MVVSEAEAPIILANLVCSGCAVVQRGDAAAPYPGRASMTMTQKSLGWWADVWGWLVATEPFDAPALRGGEVDGVQQRLHLHHRLRGHGDARNRRLAARHRRPLLGTLI
jgi:hypothetical protein